jgi:hypothetical protein
MRQAFQAAPIVVAIGTIAVFFVVAGIRLPYPFELVWLEGDALDHVRRLRCGAPLFVPPSLDWIPSIYAPLYYVVSAGVSFVTGVALPTLRLVSVAATAATLVLLYRFVLRETAGREFALLAAGLFAATYSRSGAWLDAGRGDSLYVALALGGLCALRTGSGPSSALLAGALLCLSVLTKQTALVIAIPATLGAIAGHRSRGVLFTATWIAGTVVVFAALHAATDGWSTFYLSGVPSRHTIEPSMWVHFWTQDILAPFAVTCGLAVHYALFPPHSLACRERRLDLGIAAGLLACAWAGRLNRGGGPNVLMPAHALLAAAFGLGAANLRGRLAISGDPARALVLASVLCLFQFALLAYNPLRHLPLPEVREAGEASLETVRGIDGDVYIPQHGYMAGLVGKREFANRVALQELAGEFGGEVRPEAERVIAELRDAIVRRRFSAIILHGRGRFRDEIMGSYRPAAELRVPILGKETRRAFVYIPRKGVDG